MRHLATSNILSHSSPASIPQHGPPPCKNEAKHLHGMMVRTADPRSSLKKVIDFIIHRNGFFGQPDNVLLAMITDERPHIIKLLKCGVSDVASATQLHETMRALSALICGI